MKVLSAVILTLLTTALAFSQGQPITILRATYGADSRQVDVTARVAQLVASGSPIQANTRLAGRDPAFGKVKTLTVVYEANGQQFVVRTEENDYLDFGSSSIATAAQMGLPTKPQLAPPGVFYLAKRQSITNSSGIIGVNVGTQVRIVSETGYTARVTTGEVQFDVDKSYLTNDWSQVAPRVQGDAIAQAALEQRQLAEKAEAVKQQQARHETEAEAARQAEIRRASRPGVGSYSNSSANPLNHRPTAHLPFRQSGSYRDTSGLLDYSDIDAAEARRASYVRRSGEASVNKTTQLDLIHSRVRELQKGGYNPNNQSDLRRLREDEKRINAQRVEY